VDINCTPLTLLHKYVEQSLNLQAHFANSMSNTFSRKRHRQSALSLWYQAKLRRNPFLFFGLPFLSIIVIGSYALSSFTTIRYERHDQKVKIMTEEELLKLNKDRRRPDIREEYNVSATLFMTNKSDCWRKI
jgi:cytochrome c oxidase assembly protein subunit 16